MVNIRVGCGRVYNASECSVVGRGEVGFEFKLPTTRVEVLVGPRVRHKIFEGTIGPPVPRDYVGSPEQITRRQPRRFPAPEKYPADLYVEIVAFDTLQVDDVLAEAFFRHEPAARSEMIRRTGERRAVLATALDLVAGYIGLRFSYLLVHNLITEQLYAYRDDGHSYAYGANLLRFNVVEPFVWDLNDDAVAEMKKSIRAQQGWNEPKAGDVLGWLLRAWGAEDKVLEFVSLFIPLECVIPAEGTERAEAWAADRDALLKLLDGCDGPDKERALAFARDLRVPPPTLAARFAAWAERVALPGWHSDVEAFKTFNKVRNSLVHRGDPEVETQVEVSDADIRTLGDLVERYVSVTLFGDADVYRSPKRPNA